MTATNDFQAFGTGGSANVLSQAAYMALLSSLITNGFTSGEALSTQVNKVLRQAAFGSAALGQLISGYGVNAADDGNLSEFVTNLAAAIGASVKNKQLFTTSGTFTVPVGVTALKVTVIGGGGGGGANNVGGFAGGGASGGKSVKWITGLTPGATVTVTIGAGGAGAATGTTAVGTSGSTSSFGAFCSATGGTGGGGNPGGGGTPGVGSGGDINDTGTQGQTGGTPSGGLGGGPGGGAGGVTTTAGSNATGFGGGGGGGATGGAGGTGFQGYLLVEW